MYLFLFFLYLLGKVQNSTCVRVILDMHNSSFSSFNNNKLSKTNPNKYIYMIKILQRMAM